MKIRERLRSVLWRVPVEEEVRDELAHHIELRTEELVDRGMERSAARADTREIGVRMALGATSSGVVRDVVFHGLKPVAIGLAVGLVGALGAGNLLETQLFQIGARDPIALGSVVVLMMLIGLLATIIPAWRASLIDPATALHDH